MGKKKWRKAVAWAVPALMASLLADYVVLGGGNAKQIKTERVPWLKGVMQLDAVLAALVGLTILWSGWELIRQSVIGLMDVAVDPKELTRIREIISVNADGAIEAHDIRTRQAGRMTFIEFHLVVPGAMAVSVSHDICDQIERALRAEVVDALITIHVEPEAKAKHTGVVVI